MTGKKVNIAVQGFITFNIEKCDLSDNEILNLLINILKKKDANFLKEKLTNLYIKPELSFIQTSDGYQYKNLEELTNDIGSIEADIT